MVAKESVRSPRKAHSKEMRKRVSRSDELREALEEMIITGRLAPKARIDEGALADEFQVSRTPMREAIKGLIATGMLEMRPRQGVSVAAISIPKLMEMFETMANLEGMCAKYATRRATPGEIAGLEEIQRRLEEELGNGNPDRFYEINAEFHELLCEASHTEFIADQTRMLRRRVSMYRKHVTYLPGRMVATIGEHARIIEAIKAKDPQAAAAAAIDHLNLLGDDMIDFIARLTRSMDVFQ